MTRGSAGMDVSTSIPITKNSLKIHKVPLEAQGLIERGLSALLLGRSSAALQGIYRTNTSHGISLYSTHDYPC